MPNEPTPKMKSAEEWAVRIQNSKEPWPKLVEMIQLDAFKAGARWAAGQCGFVDDTPCNDFERGENSGMLTCEIGILTATNNLKEIPE